MRNSGNKCRDNKRVKVEKIRTVLSECDIEKVWFGQRIVGEYVAAKLEHRGRIEQRSASDLSTQTTALLLSTSPQTDKELCTYIAV